MSASQQGPDAKIVRRLGNGRVKNIIIVLSGKGGVGKSSVAAQLALSISQSDNASSSSSSSSSTTSGNKVGILDVDLTGPSIPRMLGLDGQQILQSSDGWVPVYADKEQKLAVMSVGFLLKNKNDSVVWRGPKKNAMIKQFLGDVRWGELDYLIIDTPPGTSDEHISLLEYLRPFSPSAVLVTTPQAVSLADNLRSLDFTKKVQLPLLGLIENMSGYVCPHCAECTNVWGRGGGEALASREGIPFLGRIPIDPGLVRVLDDAKEEAVNRVKSGAPARGDDRPRNPSDRSRSKTPMDTSEDSEQVDVSKPLPISTTAEDGRDKETQAILQQTTTPAGTMLSRTLLSRYKDSQTFPIFAKIARDVLKGAQEHARKIREEGDPGALPLPV
ncbi:unnamed protein product [Sympodiomycopsis kandeliae]